MNIERILIGLREHEGARPKPYDDDTGHEIKSGVTVQGNITVGIGRNLTSDGLSDAEMEFMARNDIEQACMALDRHVPNWRQLSENRQDVLVDMAFNLENKIGQFVKMISAIMVKDFKHAADEIRNSAWASQVGESRTKYVSDAIENG